MSEQSSIRFSNLSALGLNLSFFFSYTLNALAIQKDCTTGSTTPNLVSGDIYLIKLQMYSYYANCLHVAGIKFNLTYYDKKCRGL